MNDSEAIAIGIIESLIPDAVMHFVQHQSAGEHDFNLVYKSGQAVPLEVTVSTDATYEGMVAAIRKPQKGGHFVQAKLCRQGWYVSPAPGANVKKIRQHIDAYLADIEAEGRNRFFAYTDTAESMAVARLFTDLRIEAGTVFEWKQPRLIGIAPPGQETELGSEHLERAVELEGYKPDNVRKLGAVNAPERHLFVYIEHGNFPAWYAINGTAPPARIPSLPGEVTHVWAVAPSREPGQYIVWRASSSQHWFSAGTVTLTADEIRLIKARAS